jgi:Cysteine rich repeat
MINIVLVKRAAASSLVFLALAHVAPAAAQQPSADQISAIRSSCRADYQAHCSSVQPGGPEALACLKKNIAALSPGCQKAVGNATGGAGQKSSAAAPANASAAAAPAAATSAPAAAPAAAVAPASPAARADLPPRVELALLRQACAPDYQANCAGIRPGGGQVMACLAANQAKLSPSCQRALVAAKQGM